MDETDRRTQVPRTELEDAKRCFDAGSCLFVDVRSLEEYNRGHIPGALSVPVSGPSEPYFRLPSYRDIILY